MVNNREILHHYLAQNSVGIMLSEGTRRGVFLPQVWQKIPNPRRFIDSLLLRGHWPKNYWFHEIKTALFSVDHFSEDETQ